jgi:hypothetical protein
MKRAGEIPPFFFAGNRVLRLTDRANSLTIKVEKVLDRISESCENESSETETDHEQPH